MQARIVKPHWDIRRINRTVVVDVRGAWDMSVAERFVSDFKAVAIALDGQDWSTLSIYHNWQLSTPDTAIPISKMVEWIIEHGCRTGAYIFGDSVLKPQLLAKMLPENAERYWRKRFETLEDAIAWLNERGYEIDKDAHELDYIPSDNEDDV